MVVQYLGTWTNSFLVYLYFPSLRSTQKISTHPPALSSWPYTPTQSGMTRLARKAQEIVRVSVASHLWELSSWAFKHKCNDTTITILYSAQVEGNCLHLMQWSHWRALTIKYVLKAQVSDRLDNQRASTKKNFILSLINKICAHDSWMRWKDPSEDLKKIKHHLLVYLNPLLYRSGRQKSLF